MFSAKLTMLFFGFIVAGTALTFVEAMPVDEYEHPINAVDNEAFEEEISADKNGIVDDEKVEEGEGEERNFFDELDAKADEEAAKEEEEELEKDLEEAEEEEIAVDEEEKDAADEEEFEEEVANAEEESVESDIGDDDEGEAEAAEEEEKAVSEEEEEEAAAEEEEKAIAGEEEEADEERGFPYNWYDKVKKFFKGEK